MRSATISLANLASPLCKHAWIARHVHQRLRGLLFRPPLQTGEGLLLLDASSVHTFGMRYRLDLVFLDRSLVITGLQTQVSQCRFVFGPDKTHHVLELPLDTINHFSLTPGDRLIMQVHEVVPSAHSLADVSLIQNERHRS